MARKFNSLAFLASEAQRHEEAARELIRDLRPDDAEKADVIVALGGDGFMLQTLHGR